MQCEEWDGENSELFKESHYEAVYKNSYKSRLYELISASLIYTPLTEANTTFLHNLRRSRAPLLRPIGVEPFEPSEPGPLCGLLFSPTSLDENMV